MKKVFVFFSAAALIVSCGSNDAGNNTTNETSTPSTTTTTPDTAANAGAATTTTTAAANPEAERGMELIAQSDCLTCHKVDEKLVGPSYREVAAKYNNEQSVIDSLAHKIIKGGVGVWGQVPMTPHPQISDADAKAMAQYVMSLKK